MGSSGGAMGTRLATQGSTSFIGTQLPKVGQFLMNEAAAVGSNISRIVTPQAVSSAIAVAPQQAFNNLFAPMAIIATGYGVSNTMEQLQKVPIWEVNNNKTPLVTTPHSLNNKGSITNFAPTPPVVGHIETYPDETDKIRTLLNPPGFTVPDTPPVTILHTPDDRERLHELTKLPGFDPIPTEFAKPAIESFPIDELHWQDLILESRMTDKVNKPDPAAEGRAHTVIKTGPDGKITNYGTYEVNPKNPTGLDLIKRVDLTGDEHYNKKTKQHIPTPHVVEKGIPGGIRPATADEIPGGKSNEKN